MAIGVLLCVGAGLLAAMPATAHAQPVQHTITITADDNVATDPAGSPLHSPTRTLQVNEGDDVTFMIMPLSGYAIKEVKADGTNVPISDLVSGTYTFRDVRADHTFEVSSKTSTQNIENFPTIYSIVEGDTVSWTPSISGGTWWISDPSYISYRETSPGTYEFTALKVGSPYAMYAVGDLTRRVSFGITGVPFDSGDLKYEVTSERATGGAGAPGENTVMVKGPADGKTPTDIVIPAQVSGNPRSPGTVYEVTRIASSAFSDNGALETVDFSNVTLTPNFVGNDAFWTCGNLNALVFGQLTAPEIVNGFYNSGPSGGTVYYPKGATGYVPSMFKPGDPSDPYHLAGWDYEPYPAPSAPQSFAVAAGNGTADLAWQAPAEGMGIWKYQYSVSYDGVDAWQDVPDSDRSTTSIALSGLENGKTYEFKVRAVNGAGEGEAALASAVPAARLLSIQAPSAITGISHATSLADILLPGQLTVAAEDGEYKADVTWDRKSAKPAYDPEKAAEQTFVLKGVVTLPPNVTNLDNLPLETSISITVEAAPAKLATVGDTALPLVALAVAALAAFVVLAARKKLSRR
ncbi:fibronectin type III domain-containing protein [Raoultibacter phocaeensis]|uniref:fibronectin type III domain-containing protein n=1 Tax=Raoultibacter phocaeensis TaxID=2479841 RepID=UPI0015D57EDC|nr:fibronectin type III domain-containing protein [Raoultibacter phocaeensis]